MKLADPNAPQRPVPEGTPAARGSPEKRDPPTPESPFRFKPVKQPLKENSLSEEQAVSIAPHGSEIRLIAFIKRLSTDRLWLELPRPVPECALQKGDRLQLKFWDYDEATYCDTEALEVSGAPTDKVVVCRPTEGEMIQRKRRLAVYDRILISFRVTAASEERLVGRAGDQVEAQHLTAAGLEFDSELPLQRGDRLEVAVQLPPDQKVTAAASVVTSREVSQGKSERRVSLQFIDLAPRLYNQLALFLAMCVPADSVEDIFWTG